MKIPQTENAAVLRTDFSDQAAWKKIRVLISRPSFPFGFRANVDFVEDQSFEGITVEELLGLIPDGYRHTFIFVVDVTAIQARDHPLLVVDLYENSGQSFRAVPQQAQGIENNLSIANMDFEEFASNVGKDGVFRGF
jgi:hypothetical protein